MRFFRESLSIVACASFPFGFESGMWDLIVLVPDHCLSFLLFKAAQAARRQSHVVKPFQELRAQLFKASLA